MGHHAADFDSW